jgi:hypothetical protein
MESRPVCNFIDGFVEQTTESKLWKSIGELRRAVEANEIKTLLAFTAALDIWFSRISVRRSPLLKICSDEMRRRYEKRMWVLGLQLSPKSWTDTCASLRSDLDELLAKAPAITFFKQRIVTTSGKIGLQEANYILRLAGKVGGPADVYAMTGILRKDPSVVDYSGPELKVDLRSLKEETLAALFNFLHERFPEEPLVPPPRTVFPGIYQNPIDPFMLPMTL